jgi:hypothetical protein
MAPSTSDIHINSAISDGVAAFSLTLLTNNQTIIKQTETIPPQYTYSICEANIVGIISCFLYCLQHQWKNTIIICMDQYTKKLIVGTKTNEYLPRLKFLQTYFMINSIDLKQRNILNTPPTFFKLTGEQSWEPVYRQYHFQFQHQ